MQLEFIRPGKPVDNAFIESFNGRLRGECLNGRFRDECLSKNWFTDIEDAQSAIAAWAKVNRPGFPGGSET